LLKCIKNDTGLSFADYVFQQVCPDNKFLEEMNEIIPFFLGGYKSFLTLTFFPHPHTSLYPQFSQDKAFEVAATKLGVKKNYS